MLLRVAVQMMISHTMSQIHLQLKPDFIYLPFFLLSITFITKLEPIYSCWQPCNWGLVVWRDFFIMQRPQKTSQVTWCSPCIIYFSPFLWPAARGNDKRVRNKPLTKHLPPGRRATERNDVICNVTKAVQTKNQLFCPCTFSWMFLLSFIQRL